MNAKELETRNIGIEDGRTTVQLEQVFWRVLDLICKEQRQTISEIVRVQDSLHGDKINRARALRVLAATYLESQLKQNDVNWTASQFHQNS